MGIKKASAALFSRSFLCLCFLSLVPGVALFAQAGRGAISGLLTDPSGAIIPGAAVTATENATGTKLSAVTTAAGIYSFISLSPGSYDVSASHRGFDTVVRKNVIVTVDQTTTANI